MESDHYTWHEYHEIQDAWGRRDWEVLFRARILTFGEATELHHLTMDRDGDPPMVCKDQRLQEIAGAIRGQLDAYQGNIRYAQAVTLDSIEVANRQLIHTEGVDRDNLYRILVYGAPGGSEGISRTFVLERMNGDIERPLPKNDTCPRPYRVGPVCAWGRDVVWVLIVRWDGVSQLYVEDDALELGGVEIWNNHREMIDAAWRIAAREIEMPPDRSRRKPRGT